MIPRKICLPDGHVFTNEELLLVSLYRMRYPSRLIDIEFFFGISYQKCGQLFSCFIQFMTHHWGYL